MVLWVLQYTCAEGIADYLETVMLFLHSLPVRHCRSLQLPPSLGKGLVLRWVLHMLLRFHQSIHEHQHDLLWYLLFLHPPTAQFINIV